MKLLIDVIAATTGGGLSRSRELARTLPALRPKDEYLFVAAENVGSTIHGLAPYVQTLAPPRLMSRVPMRLPWEHLVMPQIVRSFAPDVVLSPFNMVPSHWPAPRPILAVIVSNLAPYASEVYSLYTGVERLRLRTIRHLTDWSLARADRVFLLSTQAYSLIDEGLLEGKAEVLPMAPPPSPPSERCSRLVPSEAFFLVVADLIRYKGVDLVLEALRAIDDPQCPPVLIAGRYAERDYVRELERKSQLTSVRKKVRFLGPVEHDEVLLLMKACLASIVPSRFENPGRVPIESMSVGAAVIASDIPIFRETCGSAALYFDLQSPAELGEQMLRLAFDQSLRADLVNRGRERVESLAVGSAAERILSSLHQA